MSAVTFEHVLLADLPAEWRARLTDTPGATVTVRIETEQTSLVDDPLFGMWRDRSDMADVPAYVRSLRDDRFKSDLADRS